jgi:protein-S-isoprenylcysteine O-methyltransferase Ste14
MSLRTEFEASGAWLFRHRSFLPLLALPIVVGGLWSFSFVGTSHRLTECWNALCLLVSLAGLGVRVLTIGYVPKGTSGRNTHRQFADQLNTSGMYSLVRHPLYFGNFLIVLGMAMCFHTWWMVFVTTCLYALYYERIMFAEEAFLRAKFGEAFERWASKTPAIVPKQHGWEPPSIPFCWRTVLRREYTAFYGITSGFCLLEVAGDSVAAGYLHVDWPWVVLFGFGAVTYITLRTLKKKTKLLHVAGR